VYNTEEYLVACLDSICAQTFGDFELIAIDDGSTDASPVILRNYAAKEPRLRIVLRENRGLIHTRNELLQLARGELVAWADSDDLLVPERLARQVEYLTAHVQVVCLGAAAQCIDPRGRYLNIEHYPLLHDEILLEQQSGGAMRFPTTTMRRDVALQFGGFREPFRMGEDLDLLLRLSEVGQMANLPEVLYLYRQHLSSVSRQLIGGWIEYRDTILELARERRATGLDRLQRGEAVTISHQPRPQDLRRLAQFHYCQWARYALENRDFKLAREHALAAIGYGPLRLTAWSVFARALLKR
jgi:glycosyltransferase involved in cell wall biosynthesis